MYDIVFETGAVLLLALAGLIYALLPTRRRVVLHGRFVGMAFDAGPLSLSNRTSTAFIRGDGLFDMQVRPGDSVTWSICRHEVVFATMRVDVDAARGQGPNSTSSLDMGEVDLNPLRTGGEHCRILQLDGATVILSAAGPRIPARGHQLLDRAPYWFTEQRMSQ